MQIEDKFTLKYSHSVALTPVWEIFTIDNSFQIVLIETDFLDHGAGLPYTVFDQEVFLNEDGRFKIKNMHRIMQSPIYYMVEKNRENYFYFKNIEINLSSLLGDKLLMIGENSSDFSAIDMTDTFGTRLAEFVIVTKDWNSSLLLFVYRSENQLDSPFPSFFVWLYLHLLQKHHLVYLPYLLPRENTHKPQQPVRQIV